jgi:hypothetical protein
MQPNLSGDLPHAVDLTLPLLQDIGWITLPVAPPEPRGAVHGIGHGETPRALGPRP